MRNDDELSVEAIGISKAFGRGRNKKEVLKGIDLEVEKGEIFGILGPNGSGKTTLLSIFSTLVYPDSGELKILGRNAKKDTDKIRRLINISTGKPNFPWSLTVFENLKHSAMLYGLYGSKLRNAVEESMETFDLFSYRDTAFENLSTGLKQRLSLAKAMLNHPKLLFLDEPTTGLDPEMSLKTRSMVKRIHEDLGVSVIITTHYMPEAEHLCQKIAFMKDGMITATDTPKNIKRALKLGNHLILRYRGDVSEEDVTKIRGVMHVKFVDGLADITLEQDHETISNVMKAFKNADITEIRMEEPDLEDVFLELAR